jgi:hypothetical protein
MLGLLIITPINYFLRYEEEEEEVENLLGLSQGFFFGVKFFGE